MARKAIVQKETGLVLNTIEIEPNASWLCPEGCHLVDASKTGELGDIWDGKKFVSASEGQVKGLKSKTIFGKRK